METIAIIFIGINPLYDRSTCFCAAAKFSSIYQYTDSEWWNCLYIKYSDATSIYNLNIYTRTYPDDVEFYPNHHRTVIATAGIRNPIFST